MQARPVKRKPLDRQIFSYFRSIPLQLIQVRIGVGTASAYAYGRLTPKAEACSLDDRR